MSTTDRKTLAEDQIEAMNRGDYSAALAIAKLGASTPAIPDKLTYNSSGILIDCGSTLEDEESIRLGMALAQGFINDIETTPEYKVRARYNLSNGYGALALQCERGKDTTGRKVNWESQRDELQVLVLEPGSIPNDLKTEVFTNFGNVLDELGRSIEALDMFRRVLKLDPQHPIAAGSAGQLQMRLWGIQPSHNLRLLSSAHAYLTLALSDSERIRRHSTTAAEASYRQSLIECENQAAKLCGGDFKVFENHIKRLQASHGDWQPESPLSDWAEDELLLTVNPFPEWCPATLADDLYFDGLGTSADQAGEARFNVLANTMNQIKEDYALARYQLYLSSNPETYTAISSATKFADTLEYADYGIASGMLKSSIRQSVDIFDKLANFLNRYLELGIPDRKVSFASVWYDKGNLNPKTRVDHPILTAYLTNSGWLRGVLDVARNLNQYPAPSKDVRNKATHDFLVIENLMRPVVTLHGKKVHVDAHEYARQLLLMVKGAIVNLIAFVQREEAMRKQNSPQTHVPIEFRYAKGISDESVEPQN